MQRRISLIVVGVIVAFILVLATIFWIFSLQLSAPGGNAESVTFEVAQGSNVDTIAADLHGKNLIKNPTAFKVYVWIEQLSAKLQAGSYDLNRTMDVASIAKTIASGDAGSREVTITVLEGWTGAQMGSYLASRGLFSEDEWMDAMRSTDSRTILPDAVYPFLSDKPTGADLEGYLYPDTYKVFRDASPAAVIQKMLDTFEERVTPELIATIHDQGKTVFDVVILASLLEREVISDSDKKNAADVFYKRIEAGIPLQSDATVAFVTGKITGEITYDDLRVDSPYNTYVYPGLPKGPIANPGLSSIMAAIFPTANPYYYFLTPPSGETIFSKTLEEHNSNKAKYLGSS